MSEEENKVPTEPILEEIPAPEQPVSEVEALLQPYGSFVSGSIDNTLSQLVNLNTDKSIFHEPTCNICSSPLRDEVEKKWSETKNHEEVKKLFSGRSKSPISDDIIDNHMRFHYGRGVKEIQKVEYINKIRRLSGVELTTLDRISLGLSTLDERLAGINSITPNSDLSMADVETIKSKETSGLMRSYSQLLKLKAEILGEMKNTGELISIPAAEFVNVFNKCLLEADSDEERNIIKKLLNSLEGLSKKAQ